MISLALMLLMALAVASLAGALLFLYRWLIRRRLFPQLPRIWGVDRKRFAIFASVFGLLSLAWVALAFLAQPAAEPPSQLAAPAASAGPETAQPPAHSVQPGEPGYFPLPHRQVQTAGEERALPPGPERSLPGSEGGQTGQGNPPGQADHSGLPGGPDDSPGWATVTSLTTTSSTTTLTVPTTVKEPDASAGQTPTAPPGPAQTPAATTAPPATGQAQTPLAAPSAPAAAVTSGAPATAPPPTSATTQTTTSSTSTTLPDKQPAKTAPPPATTAPPPAKAAPPKAEKPAAPAAPAAPARYAACLGSHKTEAQALAQKTRLVQAGVMAEVWAVDLPGKGRWHRVCAGDFATLAEAQAQAKAWEKQGLAVTPFPVRRP